MKDILGIDIGGVILDFVPYQGTELDFGGRRYLETPAIRRSIESIAELNAGRFAGSVFLISAVGPEGPSRILEWLRHQDFFGRTAIPEAHVRFCASRREKLPIARELRVTHFVDDRAEVLNYLYETVPHVYLFQSLDEREEDFAGIRSRVPLFRTWEELYPVLLQ